MESPATGSVTAGLGTGRHLTFLDGIRGCSILVVMLFHERVHLPDHVLEPIDVLGAYGVDLFFVLSGCCLALPYLTRVRATGTAAFDVATYAARRMLRILPAFVAAASLLAAVAWIPAIAGRVPAGSVRSVSLGDLLAQLLFFDRDVTLVNPSFWSLSLEWRWYALFPLALALWTKAPRVVIALAGAAVAWTVLSGAQSRDLAMLPAFLAGIVAAAAILRGSLSPRRTALGFLATLALALALGRGTYFPVQTNPAWQVVSFGFVVWAAAEPRLRALLEMRWLRAVGRVAYSTYLIHEPIVRAIEAVAVPRYGDGFAMVLATAAALGAGFALAHLIELPLQRRDTVAAIVARLRPRVVRTLDVLGLPDQFTLSGAADRAREEASSQVIDLRTRTALRAAS